jgi:hypothetical protein
MVLDLQVLAEKNFRIANVLLVQSIPPVHITALLILWVRVSVD